MAEALKDQFYQWSFYEKLGSALQNAQARFSINRFLEKVQGTNLVAAELKQKMYETAKLLDEFLPGTYEEKLATIQSIAPKFNGLEGMSFPAYVELFGLTYFELSISALKKLTKYSSSEFAIRPFIIQDQEKVMRQLLSWVTDENEHVRRLCSEGCRPRLPWAMALPALKSDPSLILPILDRLKADKSLYVRKSVANNINDITKDHPDIVLELVEKWGTKKHAFTDWIIKHGLRTLVKSGHVSALELLGFGSHDIEVESFQLGSNKVALGESLSMVTTLINKSTEVQHVMLDYVIHFVKANGKGSPKVFKWKKLAIAPKTSVTLNKIHPFKKINTRKYYAGKHQLEIQLNGQLLHKSGFDLEVPTHQ